VAGEPKGLGLIWEAVRALAVCEASAANCCGVTRLQALVLYELYQSGGMSMGALAGRMRLALSTMTRIVDRLVAAGWVRRRTPETDRRQVVCALTSAGAALSETLEARFGQLYEAMMARVAEQERDVFWRALEAIEGSLDEIAATSRRAGGAPESGGNAERGGRLGDLELRP
jgi:DNA-binding MarR family transcriptional regulator